MKTLFATALLWIGIFMGHIEAQKVNGDSLNILNRNEIYARLIHPNIYDLKKNSSYKKLLSSFIGHLESVKEQIPDYPTYQISYRKGTSLKVEEVTGTIKYKVENDEIIPASNQNTAYLTDGQLHIYLYFSEINDLMERDYELTIQNALENINESKGLKKLFVDPYHQTYNYSYSENKLIKNIDSKPRILGISIFPSASFGVYKNKPIYELSAGVGINLNPRKKHFLYITHSTVFQHNDEAGKTQRTNLAGIAYQRKRIALKAAIPINHKTLLNDIDYRMSISIFPRKRAAYTLHLYHDIEAKRLYPGLSFGLGF